MQSGKIRRTVCKLQQLRDDYYSFHNVDLTLWVVRRTKGSRGRLPPGLNATYLLFEIKTGTYDYFITSENELDENTTKLSETFCSLLQRSDDLLDQAFWVLLLQSEALRKDTGITPGDWDTAAVSLRADPDYQLKQTDLTPQFNHTTLYTVMKLALSGCISTFPACQLYWQGDYHLFSKSGVDEAKLFNDASWHMVSSLMENQHCLDLDWFTQVGNLTEAVGDTLDEIITRLEQSETVESSDPPVSSGEKQPQSKPNPPQTDQPDGTSVEKSKPSDREVAFSFLLLWHQYGTANFNAAPIPGKTKFVKWMLSNNHDKKPIPSYSTVWRLLEKMFGSKPKYEKACQNGTLEPMLKIANREGAQVFQGNTRPERTATDPESNLD